MSKQIYFFMSEDDEKDFVSVIVNSGDILMNKYGISLTETDLLNKENRQIYIKSPQGNLRFSGGFLDEQKSDVIEFLRCDRQKTQAIYDGRLYLATHYYDQTDTLIRKGKWLEHKYNYFRNWIIKQYRLSNDKHYYIGNNAYQLMKADVYKMLNFNTEIEFY